MTDTLPSSFKSHRSLQVAVLMGGTSNEREVSLSSGNSVLAALQKAGHTAYPIDVTEDITTTIQSLKTLRPDVVFNALHGPGGEDGTIQGILEWLHLPYTHSHVLASAMAMDKASTRMALEASGLPIAKGIVLTPDDLMQRHPLPLPYVVKPLAEGSSVGVSIIRNDDEERRNVAKNWAFGSHILVEEFIPGRELTVSVLDDTPLAVTEIQSKTHEGFYDFNAKYTAGESQHVIPAQLPHPITQRALTLAHKAHKALGCDGASRTDFRYDEEHNRLIILEVNTQPGMTPTSLLPEQAAWRGLSYPHLCHWLVAEALHLNHYPVASLLTS